MKIKRGVRRAPVSLADLTLPSIITAAVLALAGCSAGAGSGGNGNNVSVTINNKVASVQAGTGAISFSATVQNDSGNSGVTWSLTANGTACSPTCGTLSQANSTSVTYTPPASAGASPNNQPTLTATSVAKTSKSDADTFTIGAALSVTINNKVNSVNNGASSFLVIATLQNDSTNSGVIWTLTANGAACSPASACGTLSGATASSVTYSPPSTVPGSPNNQPTITATSVHDGSKSDSESFTITKAPVVVKIEDKVTSIVAGSPAYFFAAEVQNPSGSAAVSWQLTANGANCTGTCGTLSVVDAQSVNYNPPASVPTAPFNTPTLTAISSADNTKSDSDAFTIAAAPPISVAVTQVTSVLAGSTGGVNFSASVQNDFSSPPKGVTWSLTAGGSACSPTCGSLSNIAVTSVTYTPPGFCSSGT